MTTAKPKMELSDRAVFSNSRKVRRDMLIIAAQIWPGEKPDENEPRPIWLFNISEGGIAFRANKSLEPSSIHYLRASAGPLHLECRIRIIWCRRRDNGSFEAGAEFMRD